jgi:hypothetical protein
MHFVEAGGQDRVEEFKGFFSLLVIQLLSFACCFHSWISQPMRLS